MKYRKKPKEIEAFRMGIDPRPDWFQDKVSEGSITTHVKSYHTGSYATGSETYCRIKTLEGIMIGDYGDYIIREENGKIFSCISEVFEENYEPVTSSSVEHEIEEEELKWHD